MGFPESILLEVKNDVKQFKTEPDELKDINGKKSRKSSSQEKKLMEQKAADKTTTKSKEKKTEIARS